MIVQVDFFGKFAFNNNSFGYIIDKITEIIYHSKVKVGNLNFRVIELRYYFHNHLNTLNHSLIFTGCFCAQYLSLNKLLNYPAVVAWLIESLLNKKCHFLGVDHIQLGEVYMEKILKELWTCYRLPQTVSSSNQSRHTTQIRTHPRAKQQGCIKCRCQVTVPVILTQEAIPEEGL